VSTPLHWEELTPAVRPRDFTMGVARRRLDVHGDLFAAVLEDPRPLAPAQRALNSLAR
jgi:DNA primase